MRLSSFLEDLLERDRINKIYKQGVVIAEEKITVGRNSGCKNFFVKIKLNNEKEKYVFFVADLGFSEVGITLTVEQTRNLVDILKRNLKDYFS